MPVIPALGRLRQEDREFKVSLGYRVNMRTVWAVLFQNTKMQKQNYLKINLVWEMEDSLAILIKMLDILSLFTFFAQQ
jgi:hypothetical protein